MKLEEIDAGIMVLLDGRKELVDDNKKSGVTTLRRTPWGIDKVLYNFGKGKARSGISDYATVIIVTPLEKGSEEYILADSKLTEAGVKR